MKFPLHLLLASSSAPLCAWGYLPSAPALLHHSSHRRHRSSSHLHYKEPSSSDITSGSSDNSSSSSSSSGDASIIWSVLANTERWISDTLDRSNKAANARLDAEELKLKKKRKKRRNCTLPMRSRRRSHERINRKRGRR
mmetsp:Transcript_18700/g.32878  ORF Transcript_18700/g.32878 Transcript_18700/m.32878 type:complete len:139 (-) Transcript_18700:1409-1825(-)